MNCVRYYIEYMTKDRYVVHCFGDPVKYVFISPNIPYICSRYSEEACLTREYDRVPSLFMTLRGSRHQKVN